MRDFGVPAIHDLCNVLFNEEECIIWLLELGIISTDIICSKCGYSMKRFKNILRCRQKGCRKSISLYKGTFFAHSHLTCNEMMHFAYLWLTKCTSDTIRCQTGHSTKTVTSYCKHFRQLVASTLDNDDEIIGGEGIVIQIDETKMGLLITQVNGSIIEDTVSKELGS